uniref:Pre-mRNA-splicing factor SYF2 n=1 Tax=Arcella intermedia TaxID=1963864 RepID=A0A6B2LGT1_9EUKA|eukprot:TRINITY_DN3705_c0_g1_i1.p1 TRINITY_DN3705_c0_g1~~TRINITY_DN3705_c0_g1_i1.p1  ORF type:complete len:258 (+),score=82.69 TRINITY_DN3705_c0_g1_i1:115-774(+)
MSRKERLNAKLFDLQLKKNECRSRLKQALNQEVGLEKEGLKGKRKRERDEEEKRRAEFEKHLKEQGLNPDRYYRMHQTQETQDLKEKVKKSKKNPNEVDIYGDEVQYRSFKRRTKQVSYSKEEYEKQKVTLGDDFYRGMQNLTYGADAKDTPERIEALVNDLQNQVNKREAFSRRRPWNEEKDIDFINERNRKFNAKVARAFDPYTVEIRENLERGTAL